MRQSLQAVAWGGVSVLLAGLAGCGQSTSPSGQLYVPGQRLVLTVRNELRDEGIGVSTSSISRTTPDGKTVEEVVERVETKRSSVLWSELELPVDVAASWRLGCTDISMTVARFASGDSYKDDKGVVSGKSFDTATSKPRGDDKPVSKESQDELRTNIKDISFHAAVDPAGNVVAFDARGGFFDDMKKEWSKERSKESRITQDQIDQALRVQCFGVFSALSDAAAYLPPSDVQPGLTWQVVREKVYPYHAYGSYMLYMITNGCRYSQEKSTCEAVSVQPSAGGRIATVRITGRRVPMHPEAGMPRRVDYMETSGELRFNLDTREVISLHIEDKPIMLTEEDRKYIAVTFACDVGLKKR